MLPVKIHTRKTCSLAENCSIRAVLRNQNHLPNVNLLAVSEAAADILCVAGGRPPLPLDAAAVYAVTFPDSN